MVAHKKTRARACGAGNAEAPNCDARCARTDAPIGLKIGEEVDPGMGYNVCELQRDPNARFRMRAQKRN